MNIISRLIRQMYPPLRVGKMSRSLAMSRSRPDKQPGNALIAMSGGAGSTMLLDIMTGPAYNYVGRKNAAEFDKTKGVKQSLWDQGTVVYVEFCGVLDGTEDRTEGMRRIAEEHGMDFLGLRAEDVFDPSLRERLGSGGTGASALYADLTHPGMQPSMNINEYPLMIRSACRILINIFDATRVPSQLAFVPAAAISTISPLSDPRPPAHPRCELTTRHLAPTTRRDLISSGRTHHIRYSARPRLGSTTRARSSLQTPLD